jgi:hypothetical protein
MTLDMTKLPVMGCRLIAMCYQLLVNGYLLLVTGHWLCAIVTRELSVSRRFAVAYCARSSRTVEFLPARLRYLTAAAGKFPHLSQGHSPTEEDSNSV